jgi:hypothetical protein
LLKILIDLDVVLLEDENTIKNILEENKKNDKKNFLDKNKQEQAENPDK